MIRVNKNDTDASSEIVVPQSDADAWMSSILSIESRNNIEYDAYSGIHLEVDAIDSSCVSEGLSRTMALILTCFLHL